MLITFSFTMQAQENLLQYKWDPTELKKALSYEIDSVFTASEPFYREEGHKVAKNKSFFTFIGKDKMLLELEGRNVLFILDHPGEYQDDSKIPGLKHFMVTNWATKEPQVITTNEDEDYYVISYKDYYVKITFAYEDDVTN